MFFYLFSSNFELLFEFQYLDRMPFRRCKGKIQSKVVENWATLNPKKHHYIIALGTFVLRMNIVNFLLGFSLEKGIQDYI